MKKHVLFISRVSFLDEALEYINEAKNIVKLDVLIEIDPYSKKSNIINIYSLQFKSSFVSVQEVVGAEEYKKFRPYIDGCNSFRFFVHTSPHSFSISSIIKSYQLFKYIKSIKPSFIHFDDISLRFLSSFIFFSLTKFKIILNVHDPIHHSGEKDKKDLFARNLIYKRIYKFSFFSNHSKNVFVNKYGDKIQCIVLKLRPYLFYRNYAIEGFNKSYISFVGRISEYKGIDLFLEAIVLLNKRYPRQEYLIAGLPHKNYNLDKLRMRYSLPNTIFKIKHLGNKELSELIQESKVVVCPYKDATQSGVIMTSFALCTPVIVTNIGGLPEYVQNGITGLVCEATVESITEKIENIISNDINFKKLSNNIRDIQFDENNFNYKQINELYS